MSGVKHTGAADVRSAFMRLLKSAARVDRSAIDPRFMMRGTLGVALAVFIGLLLHNPNVSVMAGIGALFVGVSSQPGVYRTRLAAMLATSAVIGISAFAGSVAGANLPLIVALTALWGFAYGLLPLFGRSGQLIGMYGALAMVIGTGFPAAPLDAALRASVYVAGGMVQVLLLIVEWPLRRFTTERGALARACRALAAYAREIPFAKLVSPDPAMFTAAGETLADPHPLARAAEARTFRAMFDAIGRIRARLAALTTDRYLIESSDNPQIVNAILSITSSSSEILSEIADAVEEGRAPAAMSVLWNSLDARVDVLSNCVDACSETAAAVAARDAVADARAYVLQLRDLYRLTCDPRRAWSSQVPARPTGRSAIWSLRSALGLLRANLRWSSASFKHGLRLAAICGFAMLAGHLLPLHRPYWVPLTALLILRPDYGATFSRGIGRIVGTLAGALLIVAIAATLKPNTDELAALTVVFAVQMYAFVFANYAISAMAVTVIAISMVGMIGEGLAVSERVEATMLAAVFAFIGYLAFPAWTHRQLRENLANLLDRQCEYITLVLALHANPSPARERAVLDAERSLRAMRAGVDTALKQMLDEPVHPDDISVRTSIGVISASRRLGIVTLALRARIGEIPPFEQLEELAIEVRAAMQILSGALRRRTIPAAFPALAEAQKRLVDAVAREPSSSPLRGIVMKTELLVESLSMMADLLERLERSRTREALATSAAGL